MWHREVECVPYQALKCGRRSAPTITAASQRCKEYAGTSVSREDNLAVQRVQKNNDMTSKDSKQLQIFMFAQHRSGVSKALWPANIRRIVATDKAAQRRRRRIANRQWEIVPATPHTPETPLPSAPTRVRELETVNLSRSNVEHFLDTAKH